MRLPVVALVGIAKALIDLIPPTDPELRRLRLEARLERQRMKLEAKLKKGQSDYEDIDSKPWG